MSSVESLKKPEIFKKFLIAMEGNEPDIVEGIWENDGDGRKLVESVITVTLKKSVDMDVEKVDGGRIGG